VVIVALGESVVAVGLGAAGLPVTAGLAGVAVLGLAISFALWWAYFGDGDDERAEQALAAIPGTARTRMALYVYGFAHYPLLLGIVLLAAGLKKAIGHAVEPPEAGLLWPWPAARRCSWSAASPSGGCCAPARPAAAP
jgi:low temperature requirement protein LtrA